MRKVEIEPSKTQPTVVMWEDIKVRVANTLSAMLPLLEAAENGYADLPLPRDPLPPPPPDDEYYDEATERAIRQLELSQRQLVLS